MQLLLGGVSRKEIATRLGLHETTVSLWQRHPEFQAELEKLRGDLTTSVKVLVGARLQNESGPSLTKIVDLRDNARSEKVQLGAAQDILDRAGYKPVERHAVLTGFVIQPELVEAIRSVVQELALMPKQLALTTSLPERR